MNTNYPQRLFPQQTSQPLPFPQTSSPPPPPPPPPPPTQQQAPQININDLTQNIIKTIGRNPTELGHLHENISKALDKLSNKCMFNHSLLNIPSDKNNELLSQIKQHYFDYYARSLEEKGERIFKDFCPACIYFKLGLFCDDITRELKTFSCSTTTMGTNNSFKLGSFAHAFNPYKPDRPLKNVQSNHPSEKIAFPSGTLLIPTGKILLQLLALPQEILAQGLKIVQIMSKEKNVEDVRAYYRFFERNKVLDPGYYKLKENVDIQKLNVAGEGDTITENERKEIADIYEILKKKAKGGKINVPESAKPEESKFGIMSDINMNEANIFQNGQPLTHITRGDGGAEPKDIKMKIFDLNPIFVDYLQSMLNIQDHLENKTTNLNNNYYNYQSSFKNSNEENLATRKMRNDYLSLWKPAAPIMNTVYFDLLMMGFYNELNVENLIDIPPFNDRCVYTQHNILLVNSDGDCIMTSLGNDNEKTACSIFNKILRLSNIPIQQKTVATGFPQNVNDKGIPPKSNFPSDILQTIKSVANAPSASSQLDEIKAKYNVIYDFHKHQSQNYHNNIKNNLDRLRNYFCQFKDDMGEDLSVEGNEIVFDIATRLFPQVVIQSNNNKNMYSLHFAETAETKPIVNEDPLPNCVFVRNLGFANLLNICDHVPLVLKNTYVYLENLVKRDVEGHVNKTADNCKFDPNANDDDESTRTFSPYSITRLPQKRKFDPESTIDLVGKGNSEFDYSAYMKMTHCPQPTTFNDYVNKYSHNTDKHCPRRV